jgi:hypothetical protein
MYISFLILQIFISNKNQKERNFRLVQLVAKKREMKILLMLIWFCPFVN